MSDNWITLVPENPLFVPEPAKQFLARRRLAEIVPRADAIEIKDSETVQFFECGANFERVLCPACRAEVPMDWWQERMDEDFDDGFKLAKYRSPCCGSECGLHELLYDWPQAFGRFALEAMNPDIGTLDEAIKTELEKILETKLIVIYVHI